MICLHSCVLFKDLIAWFRDEITLLGHSEIIQAVDGGVAAKKSHFLFIRSSGKLCELVHIAA